MTNPTTLTAPAGLPFVDVVREFDAPKDAVYRAYTERELFAQWIGPKRLRTEIYEWDMRSGGTWSYTSFDDNGGAFGFRGVFHSVGETVLVQTFEFAGAPGHVSLDSASIEEIDGNRTRVTLHSVFQSLEARDAMIENGMENGVAEGFDRLEELVAQPS